MKMLTPPSECITPSVMLPEHRLSELLHQVKKQQIADCHYHVTEKSPSLYQDHVCDRSDFPLRPVHEFERHSGECWNVVFSNNGLRLATCGSDGVVFIWDMESLEMVHMLAEHEEGVCSVAWSPDDSLLITCSYDKRARIWDAVVSLLLFRLP